MTSIKIYEMPESLHRRAKIVAAITGITMTALVVKSLDAEVVRLCESVPGLLGVLDNFDPKQKEG